MKSLTIPSHEKTAPDYHPTLTFDSYISKVKNNNSIYTPELPEILKDYPGRYVYLLAQEVMIPLGNINLSVEMLGSLIMDNELNVYLDVIKRNSIRMNKLVNKLLTYQHAGKVHIEKVSIH